MGIKSSVLKGPCATGNKRESVSMNPKRYSRNALCIVTANKLNHSTTQNPQFPNFLKKRLAPDFHVLPFSQIVTVIKQRFPKIGVLEAYAEANHGSKIHSSNDSNATTQLLTGAECLARA